MLKISPKQAARREKFQKIGHAISALSNEHAWRDRKGDHQFEPVVAAAQDEALSSRIPGGPRMKTWQLIRTVRKSIDAHVPNALKRRKA